MLILRKGAAMRFEEFEATLDQAVREACEWWGLPWDYESVIEGEIESELDPRRPPGTQVEGRSLADRIESLSDEQLERESKWAAAQCTAFNVVATDMDGARTRQRKIHDVVSELVRRTFYAGQMYGLLKAARERRDLDPNGRGGGG
jgi:hypothetical protein